MAKQSVIGSGGVRCGVILAGGRSRRMGGGDKGEIVLAGRRLFDRVALRLAPQVGRILISGPGDYASGLPLVCDLADGPQGPAAGLYAVYEWLRAQAPSIPGFVTAPVDGPFLPDDLFARLSAAGGAAVASDGARDHPTFAYWTMAALETCWPFVKGEASLSLHRIAQACDARRVVWDDPHAFHNVNSPEELKIATAILKASSI